MHPTLCPWAWHTFQPKAVKFLFLNFIFEHRSTEEAVSQPDDDPGQLLQSCLAQTSGGLKQCECEHIISPVGEDTSTLQSIRVV